MKISTILQFDESADKSGRKVADKKGDESPKTGLKAWRDRVKKSTNAFRGATGDGKEYVIRLQVAGKRRYAELGTADVDEAAKRARSFYFDVQSVGWDAAYLKLHSARPTPATPAEKLTIGEYLKAVKDVWTTARELAQSCGPMIEEIGVSDVVGGPEHLRRLGQRREVQGIQQGFLTRVVYRARRANGFMNPLMQWQQAKLCGFFIAEGGTGKSKESSGRNRCDLVCWVADDSPAWLPHRFDPAVLLPSVDSVLVLPKHPSQVLAVPVAYWYFRDLRIALSCERNNGSDRIDHRLWFDTLGRS